jgi:hypothetical protein
MSSQDAFQLGETEADDEICRARADSEVTI